MKKEIKISRRQMLRMSAMVGGGAFMAACGAPAAPAATAKPLAAAPTVAPAVSKGGVMQVLNRQEYFPALQEAIQSLTEKYIKSQGFEADVSAVNPEVFGDFQAKMQAAVSAGNPPDLAYHTTSVSQMYDNNLCADMTGIVEELVKKYGAIVPANAASNAQIQGKWWSAPLQSNSGSWFVRKDVAGAAGVDLTKFSKFEDRLAGAVKMSNPAKEMFGWGMTVNKSGDGNGLVTTAFQAFGGRAVDESGKKIVFNSPETVAGIKWLADVYKDAKYKSVLPPGVESWTDTGNNEAYLAGKLAMTTNAFSVYAKAKKDGNPVYPLTAVVAFPTTNDGKLELGTGANAWYTIFRGAKQAAGAQKLISYIIDPAVFDGLTALGGGLFMPAYKNNWSDNMLKGDPAFPGLKTIMFSPSTYNGFPYPAAPNPAVDAWNATSFLTDMMANIITGKMTPEQAVADGAKIGARIFEEKGFKQ
ncbi:MAG: hypothetical protein ABIQ99_00055 [Thermoflexales bacterium]